MVAAIAVQLVSQQKRNVDYAFNRKEAKDHGEGGNIVGATLNGNVVIVDDVITTGTSVNIGQHHSLSRRNPCAIAIALDRQEIADGNTQSAVQKIEQQYNISAFSLLKLDDLVNYLQSTQEYRQHYDAIALYRDAYGCA